MEVGLGPDDVVLDGDTVPLPKRGRSHPKFSAMFIVAKRLDGSRCHLVFGTEVNLGPDEVVLDGIAALPVIGTQSLCFRFISIVAKRSPISATAELLSIFICCYSAKSCWTLWLYSKVSLSSSIIPSLLYS